MSAFPTGLKTEDGYTFRLACSIQTGSLVWVDLTGDDIKFSLSSLLEDLLMPDDYRHSPEVQAIEFVNLPSEMLR